MASVTVVKPGLLWKENILAVLALVTGPENLVFVRNSIQQSLQCPAQTILSSGENKQNFRYRSEIKPQELYQLHSPKVTVWYMQFFSSVWWDSYFLYKHGVAVIVIIVIVNVRCYNNFLDQKWTILSMSSRNPFSKIVYSHKRSITWNCPSHVISGYKVISAGLLAHPN